MALALKAFMGMLGVAVVVAVTVTVLHGTPDTLSRHARAGAMVTLRGGPRPWEGQAIWTASSYPLCRQGVTQHDADVICASLFPDRPIQHGVLYSAVAAQHSPQDRVSLSSFSCTGAEMSLAECANPFNTHDIPASNCPSGVAYIACQAHTAVSENVRLAGGTVSAGRLEVRIGAGNWSALCDLAHDTQLSALEAIPVCKSLGFWYSTPAVSRPGEFGPGSGDLLKLVPQCTGDEPDVSYCSFRPLLDTSVCNHTQDAGIHCNVAAMPPSAVQLTGLVNQPWRGSVTVRELSSQLTTGVCADRWTLNNTQVACRTAGYAKWEEAVTVTPLPSGGHDPRVRVERLECEGHEVTLAECPGYDVVDSYQCRPVTLAAVDCSAGVEVRLTSVDGDLTTGAVEILDPVKKVWMTVLNGSLDQLAAKAVCSSMRYPGTRPVVSASPAGSNTSLSTMDCSAGQDHVAQCVMSGPGDSAGQPHAAVSCFACGRQSTAEQGSVTVLTPGDAVKDCIYVITPQGPASLYKLWLDDVALRAGDLIDVRETPQHDPVGVSAGPGSHAPFALFTRQMYVRVTSGANNTDHRATLRWAPITVETVTSLTCTDDVMSVRVNLTELGWLYNDTNPAYMSLVNEGCTGTAVGDAWTIDNPHSQCYTQRQIDGDFVHYKNALIYKELSSGPIVREHRWRVDLLCNFKRQMKVGLNYTLTDVYNYAVKLDSDYSADIHLFNDSLQTNELMGNQIKAALGDDLYVRIDLRGQWNVTMHLQDCVARPTPQSDVSYTLIDDGCVVDSQTFMVYATHNSTLFHFKAFEFYSGFSTVFVHCDVTYCAPLDNSPRCVTDCF